MSIIPDISQKWVIKIMLHIKNRSWIMTGFSKKSRIFLKGYITSFLNFLIPYGKRKVLSRRWRERLLLPLTWIVEVTKMYCLLTSPLKRIVVATKRNCFLNKKPVTIMGRLIWSKFFYNMLVSRRTCSNFCCAQFFSPFLIFFGLSLLLVHDALLFCSERLILPSECLSCYRPDAVI